MTWTFIESKKQGIENQGSLYVRIRSNGKNNKYSIGYSLKKQEWERLRSMRYMGTSFLNSVGMTYANFANLLTRLKCALDGRDLSADAVRSLIASVKSEYVCGGKIPIRAAQTDDKFRLLDWLNSYFNDLKSGRRLKRQHTEKVSQGYLYVVKQLVNCVAQFQTVKNVVLSLDQVTMTFQKDFLVFLKGKGYMPNTMNSMMQTLRTIMEVAYFEKMTKVDEFRHPAFVPRPEEVDNVYLTPAQIDALMSLDFSDSDAFMVPLPSSVKKLQLARDVFLVGCFTGQRFSDYSRISTKMIKEWDGNEFIVIRQKKTGTKVLIPLDVRVKDILERYGGELPGISSKTLNKDIKFLGLLLGWTYEPEFNRGNVLKEGLRFCDMLSSHTARRSFATNAYVAGIPLSSIMAITGHSSEKNLRKYLKLSAEEKGALALRDFMGFVKIG